MNRQIVRLTYVALALVAALVVMTTYWQTWASAGLAARQDNAIRRVHEFSIDRGLIFSFEPRKRLARNRERVVGEKTLFFRRYPYGPLAAHVVGYSTVGRSRTGLERSLNDYLTASNGNLSTLVDKALDELHGRPVQGNNVVTTLDLDAQRAGERATRDELRCGGRARSAHGEGARHGVVAGVRPQRRREPLRPHRRASRRTAPPPRRCSTARAPGSSSRARRSR